MPDAHGIAVALRQFGRGDRLRGCTAGHLAPPPRSGESQLLLGEKLECVVTGRVDSIPKASVNGRKHGNNRTRFVIVSDVFDLLANRKLRHRKILLDSFDAIISPQAVCSFLRMCLPEFRTMVVALLS